MTIIISSSSSKRPISTFINTYQLVQSLKAYGFTEQQSEAINGMMSDCLSSYEAALKNKHVDMLEYEQFQRDLCNQLMKLKNDPHMTRIKDYVQSKTLQDQIVRDLMISRQRCREGLGMIRSEIKLDMSIERGRQKDNQALINMKIQSLSSKFDSECINCLSSIQKIRQETMYTIVGYLFTSVAAFLGFLRLMKS